MATCMMESKQKTKVATISQVQSLTLVRNLLRTGVSTIAYIRELFPEDSFKDVTFNGMKLKALKGDPRSPVRNSPPQTPAHHRAYVRRCQ